MARSGGTARASQMRCHASLYSSMSKPTGLSCRGPLGYPAGRVTGAPARIASVWVPNASLVSGAHRSQPCLGSLDLRTSTRRHVQHARSAYPSQTVHGGFLSSGRVCCASGATRACVWDEMCRAWVFAPATVLSPRRSCSTSACSRTLPFHSLWCSGDATAMSDAVSRTQCCIAVPSSSLQSARRLLTLVVATFCMAYAWDP